MSGMGKGAYEALQREGYRVIGWDLAGSPSVDVSSAEDVARAAASIGEPIDAVILAAGVWREMPLLQTTDEDWNFLMNINAYGIFNCVRALVPHIKRGGAIAVIASASGMRGVPFEAAYSASKFAVTGFVEAAAKELAPKGIRINAVPLGYVAEPADIADPLVFLVSHASRYITGAIIPVSGGTHCGYGPVLSSFDEKADY